MNNCFNEKFCKKFYVVSYYFLLEILPKEIDKDDLEKKYFNPKSKFNTLEDLFERMIISAQNYQRMPNVINFKDKKEKIKQLLFDYNLLEISKISRDDLYAKFQREFKLHITAKNKKQDSWYKWSQSIIDSASFLTSFKDVNDFKKFIDLFQYNVETKTALPLLISTKIFGMGFPLACDFLKEIGYTDFPKPDVHIKDIVKVLLKIELGTEISDISAYEIIIDIATKSNVSPYKLDKILWLICSGKFYEHDIKIKSNKEEFINRLNCF